PQLLLDLTTVTGRERGRRLGDFLLDLRPRRLRVRPVEVDPRGLALDTLSPDEPGERPRYAVDNRSSPALRFGLSLLDGLPLCERLIRRLHLRVREHVRMAADHLVTQPGEQIGHRELTALGADLGVEHHLEEQVAELLAKPLDVFGL